MISERIKELADQAERLTDDKLAYLERIHNRLYSFTEGKEIYNQKFAELIVLECKENFSKIWYEQGLDIRGAEISKFLARFDEHFGVEE